MGQHVDVTDPDIHEPRGVSSQQAGRVYVSDGAGSGSWERVAYDYAYGAMTITNNATNLSLTAGNLSDNNDYTLFSGAPAPFVGEHTEGIIFSVDRLTVPYTGIYEIFTYANISAFPNATAKVGLKYRVNGSTFSARSPIIKSAVSNDESQIFGTGLISLNANDFIQLMFASDTSGNLLVRDMNTFLKLVKKAI